MRAVHVIAACVLSMLAAWPATAQDGSGSFVAEPVPGSSTAPHGGYFVLDAEPGAEITQAVGLRNDAGRPLELHMAAVDAATGQLGGASYALDDEPPSRTARWISLERSTVTLQPGASDIVSFRVRVPEDAESGDHLAGISIRQPDTPTQAPTTSEGQAGASIDVQTRRIIAVQIKVPGSAQPELEIGGVQPAARPDGMYLEIAITNQGRGLTKAQGRITVADDFERAFDVDTFVPRTSIAYPMKWRDEPRAGEYRASVELRYGDDVARWTGTFTVGNTVLNELADRQVSTPAGGDSETDGAPWSVVAAAAIGGGFAIVSAGAGVAYLRRPRGKHAKGRRR